MPSRAQRETLQAFVELVRKSHGRCSKCKQEVNWRALEFDCNPTVAQMIQLSWGVKRVGSILDNAFVICRNCLATAEKEIG